MEHAQTREEAVSQGIAGLDQSGVSRKSARLRSAGLLQGKGRDEPLRVELRAEVHAVIAAVENLAEAINKRRAAALKRSSRARRKEQLAGDERAGGRVSVDRRRP